MSTKSNIITRFSIAENDYFFKQFLIKMLDENPFYSVVNNCNNGYELINRLYFKQEDVYIISLYMPILSGLEALKHIRKINKSTPILTYSSTYQKDMADILNEIPNTYYCQKNSIIIKDLLRNHILSNNDNYYENYKIEWESQQDVVNNYLSRQEESLNELSVTEIQIIKLCYEGYSNKEIGQRINLSGRTIDTYINRLTEKLGLKSKLDLVRFCVEQGYYNTNI